NRNGDEYRDIPALNTAYAADWSNGGIVYQATTGIEITYDSADYEGYALFNQKVGYEDPTWQPGGGRIVFQEKGATHTELWSANPDGSGLVALTRPETTLVDQLPSNVAPAWSPDGGQIVYLSNRAADEEAGAWRLWVMGADGSNKRPLPIDVAIDYTFGREQVVSWGPQV
ncbi:MAG: PD40 domain-containing protein, partial [Caldilineaceae bacterium]|nr:PD40 domain-containing protein [Caldilineaceae bacterium]